MNVLTTRRSDMANPDVLVDDLLGDEDGERERKVFKGMKRGKAVVRV